MAEQPPDVNLARKELTFPNGNHALAVIPPLGTPPRAIVSALGLQQPKMLLLVIGGAATLDQLDPVARTRLAQLFSRGIARAAIKTNALVVDGGTRAGVMEMMGQGIADRGRQTTLLGVAPAGRVTYPGAPADVVGPDCAPLDPNHTHFVLPQGQNWGDETETLFALADALAVYTPDRLTENNGPDASAAAVKIPVVAVLAGGNVKGIAKHEALHVVRQGWQLVVLEGSGGLADAIAQHVQSKTLPPDDADLAEIVDEGQIHIFAGDKSPAQLEQLLARQLEAMDLLNLAWTQFATYDQNANRHQGAFNQGENWIIRLGVLTTFFAILVGVLGNTAFTLVVPGFTIPVLNVVSNGFSIPLLHIVVVILPILISILVMARNRFNPGNNWILLRGSAESIKREIYRYRARPAAVEDKTEPENGQGQDAAQTDVQLAIQRSREARLEQRLGFISHQLMQTNVNTSALIPYADPIPPKNAVSEYDDGLSILTPEQYIAIRLDDQLHYYEKKTRNLESQFHFWQWLIFIFGGLGTLLAAVNAEIWVALTTAIATAITTYLSYQQVEQSLVQYNQAAGNLQSVKAWWKALSGEEQGDPQNVAALVDTTEKILESELTGWVQQMQDALADLRAEEEKKKKEEE